jgi:hypothetical protein
MPPFKWRCRLNGWGCVSNTSRLFGPALPIAARSPRLSCGLGDKGGGRLVRRIKTDVACVSTALLFSCGQTPPITPDSGSHSTGSSNDAGRDGRGALDAAIDGIHLTVTPSESGVDSGCTRMLDGGGQVDTCCGSDQDCDPPTFCCNTIELACMPCSTR